MRGSRMSTLLRLLRDPGGPRARVRVRATVLISPTTPNRQTAKEAEMALEKGHGPTTTIGRKRAQVGWIKRYALLPGDDR